ncbi:SRPBCC family protein [Azospirillum sp. A39]|uniref:SRPBCC family protein n=1 Tax=Azospirillum sp. A39 TaxID=3462279 RepID=UPI004045647D
MTVPAEDTRSLLFERQMAHPPEKVWRALTQSWLIEEWLMKNDFVAEVGHRFTFRATPMPGWSGVVNGEVVTVEAPRLLAYRWGDGSESDSGLVTLVTWTLLPRDGGTLVRMEQSGFRRADEGAHRRMGGGWPRVLERLERVADGVEEV